ncbi:MAG: hypothetical protein OSA49_05620 [Ascidiaceihabitans sp.]|nr:hypothetical protein [Ascidiaceihabitans sp.]
MTIQTQNDSALFIASSQQILTDGGLSVQIGTDFDEYREILLRDRPKQALGAPFDPDIQNLNAGNAFWLTGRDLDGDLMHTQAARLLDLKHENLGGYMFNRFREFPPAIPDIDLDRSRFRASPGARNITGRVIYHGEVWMSDKPGLFRGNGLSTVLARYGLLTAMQRWNPDYIFGFMARTVAFKGFAERMGYMHNEPGALRWYRKGSDVPMEGFLSYLSNEEARYLLEMPVSDLVSLPAAKAA